MRLHVLNVLPLLALAAAGPLSSQTTEPAAQAQTAAFAAEENPALAASKVREAIGNRPANEILSISGTQRVDDQVIYVDTLRFDDGATLQLLAGDRDAIYIVAREVRLSGPEFKARIEFADRDAGAGSDGAAPSPALAQLPRSGNNGANGASGRPGDPGKPGLIRKLPTVYIVAGKIRQSTGGVPDFSDLRINADGIDGGTGGRGGRGQNGQPGQDGRNGITGPFDCKSGPRSGGNGGNGGSFGSGGIGGDGGNGATVVFIVPPATVEAIKDVRVRNRGGLPGTGGVNGDPGSGAGGGSRGSAPGHCSSGGAHPGSGGAAGEAAGTPRAQSGQNEGQRGRVYYHVVDFFG